MTRHMRFFRPVLFGVLMAAPLGVLAVSIGNGPNAAPVPVSPVTVAAVTAKQQPEPAENLDSIVTEILERPLFSVSRQGVDKHDSASAAAAPPPPPQLPGRLAGISIRPGSRQALFENQGQKAVAVSEGQEIDGWTVASVQPDRVVLRSASGEQVMTPAKSTRPAPVLAAGKRKPAAGKNPPAANGARPQAVPGAAQQVQRPGQPNPPGR